MRRRHIRHIRHIRDVHLSCLPRALRSYLIGDLGLMAVFAPLVEVVIITIKFTKKARREDCFEDTSQHGPTLARNGAGP